MVATACPACPPSRPFYHRDGDGAVLGKSKSNDFGVLSLLLSLSLSLSLMLMLMLMLMHQQKLH